MRFKLRITQNRKRGAKNSPKQLLETKVTWGYCWNFLLFLSLKTIKNSTGQMRQLKRVCCHWIPLMIGWRRNKHTNLHMARGFSVLYHVFARKQCILCSSLRHKSYLTLPSVTSLRDSFSLGTFALGFTRLPPGSLASSRGCLLTITYH